jgi:hypothetical protein
MALLQKAPVVRDACRADDTRLHTSAPGLTRNQTLCGGFTRREQKLCRCKTVHPNLFDYSPIEPELRNFDACFFCLGVSSAGMKEREYTRLTFDLTLAAAGALARLNSAMTFVYVSGTGTDTSERGRQMWARVKGRRENALRRLPFRAVYLFRPGIIQPLHGVRSKTRWVRMTYAALAPLVPLLRAIAPGLLTTTEEVGAWRCCAWRVAAGRRRSSRTATSIRHRARRARERDARPAIASRRRSTAR